MANSFTQFRQEVWKSEMQDLQTRQNVVLPLVNRPAKFIGTNPQPKEIWHWPYSDSVASGTYTPGSDLSFGDRTASDEYGTVDTFKYAAVYVDKVDQDCLSVYDLNAKYAKLGQQRLNNLVEQAVTYEVTNAKFYVDDGSIGGTSGTYISPSTTNIANIFTAVAQKLEFADGENMGKFALVGPRLLEQLRLYLGGKDTNFSDVVNNNGRVMNCMGFDVILTNNLYWTATLAMATNPTANDTVSIAGVTFKFVSTIGTTAGNVLKDGSTAATSVGYLVGAINLTGTAGTNYVEVAADDRQTLRNCAIAATDATTSITFTGYGDIATAETLSATADVWSVQRQHALFGVRGFTDLALNLEPYVELSQGEKLFGTYVKCLTVFGKKTFLTQARKMVDVRINAAAWTS